MKRPKIVLAADAVLGAGGQGLNLQQMLDGYLADTRFDIQLFCTGGEAPVPIHKVPRAKWINRVFGLPLIRRQPEWHAYFTELHFDRYVAKFLNKCDLFQGVTGQCLLSMRKARELGARTILDVITTHTGDGRRRVGDEYRRLGLKPRMCLKLDARREAEYRLADRIRVMSTHALDTFVERGFDVESLLRINPYLDAQQFPQAQFKHTPFRICYVGRLVIAKGAHHAVQAFQQAKLPNSELILWGGTGERDVRKYYEQLLRGHSNIHVRAVPIRSVGFEKVFGEADFFVHPSLADGFGYSVAEAMACGLPAVITRTTGAADWIEDGKNGYLMDVGDIGQLKKHFQWIHANRHVLPAMGAAARQVVESHHLEAYKQRFLNLLHPVLDELHYRATGSSKNHFIGQVNNLKPPLSAT